MRNIISGIDIHQQIPAGFLLILADLINFNLTTTFPTCDTCPNDNKMFCMLSSIEKKKVGINKEHKVFKRGTVIFHEGNYSNGLYCIFKGKVKLSKLGGNGKVQILRFAKPGEIFGYNSLFGQDTCQFTATVIEDTMICVLPIENFLATMEDNSKMSLAALKLMSDNLNRTDTLLTNFVHNTVLERMAYTLMYLIEKFGYENETKNIAVQLTRADIAGIAGTTTESAIRTLADMQKKGIIQLSGKKINILAIDKIINLMHFNN